MKHAFFFVLMVMAPATFALVIKGSPKIVWYEIKAFDQNKITLQRYKGKPFQVPRSAFPADATFRSGEWVKMFEKPVSAADVTPM